MLSFDNLMTLRTHGLSLATITVHTYLAENGEAPVGRIAQACKLSERAVYKALSQLNKCSLLDHDHGHGHGEGIPHERSAPAPARSAPEPEVVDNSDPLVAEASQVAKVFPQVTHRLILDLGRAAVATALETVKNLIRAGYKARRGFWAIFIHAAKNPDLYGAPRRDYEAEERKRSGVPKTTRTTEAVRPKTESAPAKASDYAAPSVGKFVTAPAEWFKRAKIYNKEATV